VDKSYNLFYDNREEILGSITTNIFGTSELGQDVSLNIVARLRDGQLGFDSRKR
jgi:hypothetical protein